MKLTSLADMPCPVARSLAVVGQGWSLLIIRNAFFGHTRFKEFQENLGLSRNILTARLQELSAHGVLKKIPDRQGSKYPEYVLTEKGQDLMPVLITLADWGNKWEVSEDGSALEMIDTRDGKPIPQQQIRDASGEIVPREVIGTRFSKRSLG